jgi:hypothetical protein
MLEVVVKEVVWIVGIEMVRRHEAYAMTMQRMDPAWVKEQYFGRSTRVVMLVLVVRKQIVRRKCSMTALVMVVVLAGRTCS